MITDWLEIQRGEAPLVVAFPHTGTEIPAELAPRYASPWIARRDADWWIGRLYDFCHEMGATTVRTGISRSVIDVNRDPSGASLYPGQATTELCPTTTFDGEALYQPGAEPDAEEIEGRRETWFVPYHASLAAELERLKARHGQVVLYDAHSIRSCIPRLFEGQLPQFNIGTNTGASSARELAEAVEAACDRANLSRVTDGRFKGGWTTRHYGQPDTGVHALQMELACRGYMVEPQGRPSPDNWPSPYEPHRAEALRRVLRDVLAACLAFAKA